MPRSSASAPASLKKKRILHFGDLDASQASPKDVADYLSTVPHVRLVVVASKMPGFGFDFKRNVAQNLQVLAVTPSSPSAGRLWPGQVITHLDGLAVSTMGIDDILNKLRDSTSITLNVQSEEQGAAVPVPTHPAPADPAYAPANVERAAASVPVLPQRPAPVPPSTETVKIQRPHTASFGVQFQIQQGNTIKK